MKFTEGYWNMKPGVTAANIGQIREVKVTENAVYLYAVPRILTERAQGGPALELYISAPAPDILRTKVVHFAGSAKKTPRFEMNEQPCTLQVEDTEASVTIRSGRLKLVVKKAPCEMIYYWDDAFLTRIGDRFGQAMISTISTPDGPYMRAQMDVDVGEKIYGLGERFTPLVKNGQSVDCWNYDGGTCSERSYKNIPFYITNRGYGLLVDSTDNVSFEVCSEMVTRVQFSLPGETLEFLVIGGGDMKGVLRRYTGLTGRPPLVPAWTFGLWLSSCFETSYDKETVDSMVDGMAQRNIPLSVFHFDCYWMKENELCGFEWDPETFPDPKAYLRSLKDKGLRICVWLNSYIGQKSPAFHEAAEAGYLLKKPNGDVYQGDFWQAAQGFVDFTNPDACAWYQEKLRGVLDMGVDCLKIDFGEMIPTDCVYFDGSDPQLMHNYYSYLYAKAVYEVLEEYYGAGNVCLYGRSATVGCQKFPVHFVGDCTSNYRSMAEVLRAGLSFALCGFGFWTHDISGFEGTAPAHLYKRWVAFGLLSTHSRLHGSHSYRVPWLFDDESEDVLRFFTHLKYRIMPYLFDAAVLTHEEGIPALRAMALEFPEDPACDDLEAQYMLGGNLLVAPIFHEDGSVSYYLPKGTWTHFLTGEAVEGGSFRRETYDFFGLPLFARENSIIAVGREENTVEYDYAKGTILHLFALKDGAEATCRICNMEGHPETFVQAVRQEQKVTVTVTGRADALSLALRTMGRVVSCTGGVLSESEEGYPIITLTDPLCTFELEK